MNDLPCLPASIPAPSVSLPVGDRIRPLARWLPGVLLSGALALAAVALAGQAGLQALGISALTMAILLGMLVGNTVYPWLQARGGAGVDWTKHHLLRLGVILYGLRLTFQDIGQVGAAALVIDALVLCSTFGLAWWAGRRLFGLDRETVLLVGAGASICGAAAVMATQPVVRGRTDQTSVAVATVVLFGTLSMFLYPMLFQLDARHALLAMTPHAYGIYVGSTIHEVAQVVVAGQAVAEQAADTAVITKMVRVIMLAPFLIGLSAWLSRQASSRTPQAARGRITVPWFALGFVAVVGLNSLGILPPAMVKAGIAFDNLVLAMAMAALGMTTTVTAIRRAGAKPMALAALLFAWLIGGGLAINLAIGHWLG